MSVWMDMSCNGLASLLPYSNTVNYVESTTWFWITLYRNFVELTDRAWTVTQKILPPLFLLWQLHIVVSQMLSKWLLVSLLLHTSACSVFVFVDVVNLAVKKIVHKVIETQARRFMAEAAYHVKQRGTFFRHCDPKESDQIRHLIYGDWRARGHSSPLRSWNNYRRCLRQHRV